MYAWAGDAPQLDLPEDVGYKGTTHYIDSKLIYWRGALKIEILNFLTEVCFRDFERTYLFLVGGDSEVEWLVLQVHYATTRFIDSEKGDDSGISIRYTNVLMPR